MTRTRHPYYEGLHMTREFTLYDVVALTSDFPEHRLVRGQVGTVVHIHDAETVEVDFTDNDGCTYALVAVPVNHLMVLHHQPAAV